MDKTCPICQAKMIRKDIIVYKCPNCGFERT